MNINRNNYEVYMVDYLDGNLNASQVAELKLFLDQNPDIKEETEGLAPQIFDNEIHEDKVEFEEKSALKQVDSSGEEIINSGNCDTWFIAAVEGTLSKDELIRLDDYLKENPERKKDFDLFMATKLVPEEHVTFENKNALKANAVTPVNGIDAANYEEKMVAGMEGDLTLEEAKAFREFMIQNPGLEKEFQWMQKTKLQADDNIKYPGKRQLKRFTIGLSRKTLYNYAALAAAVAMLISFSWNTLFPPETINNGLADLNRSQFNIERRAIEGSEQQYDNHKQSDRSAVHKQKNYSNNNVADRSYTRENINNLQIIESSGGFASVNTNNEYDIEPDYRIYISDLYQVNSQRMAYRNDVMMAMAEGDQPLSVEDLAWNQLEKWTGVQKTEEFDKKRKNIFWTAVDLGLTGVNKLTGSDFEVNKKVNESGEVTKYKIKSDSFDISRSR